MFSKISKLLLQYKSVLAIYIVLAIGASAQMLLLPDHLFQAPHNSGLINDVVNTPQVTRYFEGHYLKNYNNYVIFKYSFPHLLKSINLYALHPADHWDLFKYSPSFAVCMGLFAYTPDYIGLTLWLLLNTLLLFLAIKSLPLSNHKKMLLLWFLAMELLTSMQNCQSNGILCALIILGYTNLNKGKTHWAALLFVAATFIKIYGGAAFVLFLFYPNKIKFLAWSILWTILIFLMPLLFTPWSTLLWQYHNWWLMMQADQTVSYGISVIGWMHSWFGFNNKAALLGTGALLFVLPLLRFKSYQQPLFQMLYLASLLLWIIIFNHKAESATYIIAVAGAGIWYFSGPPLPWRKVLLGTVFIFTCLSFTDVFPPYIKHNFVMPYCIKAVPCILLWFVLTLQLLTFKVNEEQLPSTQENQNA